MNRAGQERPGRARSRRHQLSATPARRATVAQRSASARTWAAKASAVIAAIGIGSLGGWEDSKRFLELDRAIEPDPAKVSLYNDAYGEWRELGAAVTPISHSIARRTAS
jgi:sugar (pentulose or hexulose) kinase